MDHSLPTPYFIKLSNWKLKVNILLFLGFGIMPQIEKRLNTCYCRVWDLILPYSQVNGWWPKTRTLGSDKDFICQVPWSDVVWLTWMVCMQWVCIAAEEQTQLKESTPFIPNIKQACFFFCPRERHYLNPQGGSQQKPWEMAQVKSGLEPCILGTANNIQGPSGSMLIASSNM